MPRKVKIDDSIIHNNKTESSGENSSNIETLKYLQELFPGKLNFSIKETARILNLSYDFIRSSIIKGSIKANKFGDRLLINIYELHRLLTEGI